MLPCVERGPKTLRTMVGKRNPRAKTVNTTRPVPARLVNKPRSLRFRRQQCLYFFPLPQGHSAFRAGFDTVGFLQPILARFNPYCRAAGGFQRLSVLTECSPLRASVRSQVIFRAANRAAEKFPRISPSLRARNRNFLPIKRDALPVRRLPSLICVIRGPNICAASSVSKGPRGCQNN